MESNNEQVEEGKPSLPEPFVFDLPSHPYQMDIRVKVEAKAHQHTIYEGLHHLRKFLLGIDDYDLVRRVCQIEENDYEHKGIGELYHLPNVPQPYNYQGEEAYQAFLSHLEKLMVIHMSAKSGTYTFYNYYREERYGHPYSLLIYVLALAPLGKYARYVGHVFLDYAAKLERDCPGLGYVYSVYSNFDMFYRHFEEEEE